jgi:enoyl-CoA hydratase/carnithine racemase
MSSFTGRFVDAAQALRIGLLVDEEVPDADPRLHFCLFGSG